MHTCGRYQRQIFQLASLRAGRRQTERSGDPTIQRSDDDDDLQFDAGRCRRTGGQEERPEEDRGDRQFNIRRQRLAGILAIEEVLLPLK